MSITRARRVSATRKSRAITSTASSLMAPASSTPVGPPPTMTKVRCAARSTGSGSISAVSNDSSMRERMKVASSTSFMPGAQLLPLVVPEIVIDRAGREDQVVVGNPFLAGVQAARGELDAPHLAQHHARVLLVAQHGADRLGDVGGRQRRGGHLVKQRLKQVIVVAVDDQHLDRRARQRARREQPAETAAHDDDSLDLGRQHALRNCTGHGTRSGGDYRLKQPLVARLGADALAQARDPRLAHPHRLIGTEGARLQAPLQP